MPFPCVKCLSRRRVCVLEDFWFARCQCNAGYEIFADTKLFHDVQSHTFLLNHNANQPSVYTLICSRMGFHWTRQLETLYFSEIGIMKAKTILLLVSQRYRTWEPWFHSFLELETDLRQSHTMVARNISETFNTTTCTRHPCQNWLPFYGSNNLVPKFNLLCDSLNVCFLLTLCIARYTSRKCQDIKAAIRLGSKYQVCLWQSNH